MTVNKDHKEGYEYPLPDKDRRGLDTMEQKKHYDDFQDTQVIPSKRRELANIEEELKKHPVPHWPDQDPVYRGNAQLDHLISEYDRLTNELKELSEYTTTEGLYNEQKRQTSDHQEGLLQETDDVDLKGNAE
jgi:hypothetical protein